MDAKNQFPASVPLSWQNPREAALLEYISEALGEEYAKLAILPEEEYRAEMRYLRELNQPYFDAEAARERVEENRYLDEYEDRKRIQLHDKKSG